MSDVDVGEEDEGQHYESRKGGYSSRIEQILHEHPDTQILITYAGKNSESGGNHIAYTIRTGVGIHLLVIGDIADSGIGPGSTPEILRICVFAPDIGELASHLDNTAHPGETHNGRLCSTTDQGQRGPRHH